MTDSRRADSDVRSSTEIHRHELITRTSTYIRSMTGICLEHVRDGLFVSAVA